MLAAERDLPVRFEVGDGQEFRVEGEAPFDLAVLFSGFYNMVLPRERRVRMLACCGEHLRPGARLWLTFLSAYVPPGSPPPPAGKTFLEALNPDHVRGDRFLVNEAVHVFPSEEALAAEARDAGFVVREVFRDQRAYERFEGRVRGYAVLEWPAASS